MRYPLTARIFFYGRNGLQGLRLPFALSAEEFVFFFFLSFGVRDGSEEET